MQDYKTAKIPKGRGQHREIYIISEAEKNRLRRYLPELERTLASIDKTRANFAFQRGKNCALNALQHAGKRYVLTMDIEDYFDSVTKNHLAGLVSGEIIKNCLINGAPRQGLPTSPLLATIALLKCDEMIVNALSNSNIDCVYTRYADDLTFSFNQPLQRAAIQQIATTAVLRSGFRLNQNKTKIQDSENGRVVITGIALERGKLFPTRKTMKKIRAAVHQGNEKSAAGLNEWASCKLPRALFELPGQS